MPRLWVAVLIALMGGAAHGSITTTQRYIPLAGETFREEAERLEERLWGVKTSV